MPPSGLCNPPVPVRPRHSFHSTRINIELPVYNSQLNPLHHVLQLAALLFSLNILQVLAQDSDWESRLLVPAMTVRLGDTAAGVGTKLEPFWQPANGSHFAAQQPFRSWIPYTNSNAIQEWTSRERGMNGRPVVLFAIFSNANKTNLIDALLHNGGEGIQPLVNGPYQQYLMGVKPGDSMSNVFAKLGTKSCTYFLDPSGAWHVRFVYFGYQGQQIIIEADAATGNVLRVHNGAL